MSNRHIFFLLAALPGLVTIASCASSTVNEPAAKVFTENDSSLEHKAAEAWLYFYPMLLTQAKLAAEHELTRNSWNHSSDSYRKIYNQPGEPDTNAVYSHAWLDLREGPINLHLPDMQDRYYVIQALDLWSQTFSVVGSRTTGGKAGTIVYLPPGMRKELYPSGHWPIGARFIETPSNTVLLLAQLQRGRPDQANQISGLQSKFLLRRHAETFLARAIETSKNTVLAPEALTEYLAAGLSPANALLEIEPADYFSWATALWGSSEVSLSAKDREFAKEIIQLGLYPGRAIQWQELTERRRLTLIAGANKALQILSTDTINKGLVHDGWFYPVEEWYEVDGHKIDIAQPENYRLRAKMASQSPGHLPLDEVVTLQAGDQTLGGDALHGGQGRQYELRFDAGGLPPAEGFWSLSIHGEDGAPVQNFLGRSRLDSDSQLTENPDGSVTIYMSHENPHGEGSSDTFNWLPIPANAFRLELRVFWPNRKIGSDGGWLMPAIKPRLQEN